MMWPRGNPNDGVNTAINNGVLFVTRSLGIGGAETQMYLLIRELLRLGYRPVVFALEAHGPMKARFEALGVPLFSGGLLPEEIKKRPWRLFSAWVRLDRAIRRVNPFVIHSWLPLMTFIGTVTGRMRCIPKCIISRRALATHQDRYPVLKWIDLAAEACCHHIIGNSWAVKKDMVARQRFFQDKISVIHNGINDSSAVGLQEKLREAIRRKLDIGLEEKVVIMVANLIHYKGHGDLISAAALIRDHGVKVRYLLVGEDRGIQKELVQRIESLGLGEGIQFLGMQQDVGPLYAASDISVLPSHEEGFSNVILESMAAGLPVIATRVGGNPEAVIDGVTGWIVPPQCPEILSKKIIDLLENPDRKKRFGSAGERRVRLKFGLRRMVIAHMSVYEAA
jgi:glycosyltransferase involved in cell wall biosynthesis